MSDTKKLTASILIISETAYKDPATDKCVPALQSVFEKHGGDKWEIARKRIVPDDVLMIQRAVMQDVEAGVNLVVTSGGTGFAVKDVTPEVCGLVWFTVLSRVGWAWWLDVWSRWMVVVGRGLVANYVVGCWSFAAEACSWASVSMMVDFRFRHVYIYILMIFHSHGMLAASLAVTPCKSLSLSLYSNTRRK